MKRVLIGLAAAASLGLSVPANAAAAPPAAFIANCVDSLGFFGFFVTDPRDGARVCRGTYGGQFKGLRPVRNLPPL